MAQIRICDRCKNEIDVNLEWFKLKSNGMLVDVDLTNHNKSFDLCIDCYNTILGIIENGDACIHFVDERKEK